PHKLPAKIELPGQGVQPLEELGRSVRVGQAPDGVEFLRGLAQQRTLDHPLIEQTTIVHGSLRPSPNRSESGRRLPARLRQPGIVPSPTAPGAPATSPGR